MVAVSAKVPGSSDHCRMIYPQQSYMRRANCFFVYSYALLARALSPLHLSRFRLYHCTCRADVGGGRSDDIRVEDAHSDRGGFRRDLGILECKNYFPGLRGVYAASLRFSGVSVGGRGRLVHVTVKGDV